MADLPYLAHRLYNKPQLATPDYAALVSSLLAERMGVAAPLDLAASEKPPERRPFSASLTDGVLTYPIVGGLVHRGDAFDASCGLQSYTHLENTLMRAVHDGWTVREGDALRTHEVKGILLDIDSPGGEAAGCFEFCDTLAEIGARVPIVALANTACCSAAYAIAASCSKVYAAPSARVGSVGVVTMHTDLSGAMAKKGVRVTFIHAGAMKAAGNSFEPLPEDVRVEIQASIDAMYSEFIDRVARRRPMSAEAIRATEARVYGADQALSLGLVDAVATYEQARTTLAAEVNRKKTNLAMIEGVPVKWQS